SQYWPNRTDTAQPKYYSDYEYMQWFLAPTPDQAYPYEIAFYEVPQLIDNTVSTNFLTDNLPDLLLFACLTEASGYLKDVTLEQTWGQRYASTLQSAQQQNEQLQSDADDRRGA